MPDAIQDQRQGSQYLSITTTLGDQAVQITSLSGVETLSAPYQYELVLYSNDATLDWKSLIGTNASVAIVPSDSTTRYIHGVISEIGVKSVWPPVAGETNAGRVYYRALLVPQLALLDLTGDCKIFQTTDAKAIATSVLNDRSVTDLDDRAIGTYTQRDYCVQWRESDLNFVRRLLEEEGITFWFEHTSSKHTLVLSDDSSGHQTTPGIATINWRYLSPDDFYDDVIMDCGLEMRLTTDSVHLRSYNFETPSTDIGGSAQGQSSKYVFSDWSHHGTIDAGNAVAKLRVAGLGAQAKLLRMSGVNRSLACGFKFTLADHPASDFNIDWVVVSNTVQASPDSYHSQILALPAATVFRPALATPRPVIASAQTAKVAGASSEEVHTDQYGRVKVVFPWDKSGKTDDTATCWLRVAQGWAGAGWGSMFIPRVGMEVVVAFLDGDPDRPLIVGCLPNAEQTVPYALDANKTRSTIKTRSTPSGSATTFNELCFEDKKDSEEIYIHAQKDLTLEVLNNETRTITNDRTTTVNNDDKLTVKKNRTFEVQEGNESHTITKGNRTLEVKEGDETYTITKGKRTVTVQADESHTSHAKYTHTVDGDYSLTVGGSATIEITGSLTIKAASITIESTSSDVSIKSAQAIALTGNTDISASATANFKATGNAGVSISSPATLEAKGSMATIKGDGMLTLQGGLVKIN